MEDGARKRERTIDTFQARGLHGYREEPVRASTRRVLIAGCGTWVMERKRKKHAKSASFRDLKNPSY